jgi:hypothetical protein
MKFLQRTVAFCAAVLLVGHVHAQVDVLTRGYNNFRTGANLSETILTTSNVTAKKFGKLYSRPVTGQIYAQPLIVNGVNIPGKGLRNLCIVATTSDNIYAFDADSGSVGAYWGKNYGKAMQSSDLPGYMDMTPSIGITGTPVIDKATNTMFVVVKGVDTFGYHLWLYSIDIRTGGLAGKGKVELAGSVPGVGAGSSNGTVTMQPKWQINRPGLLLLNGVIYIALGSQGDMGPYHGWVFAYDETTLAQKAIYCNTQDGWLGGIWMSGQGITADAAGNIYFISGNGDFAHDASGSTTGNSVTKMKLIGSQLQLEDFFTPFDSDAMNWADNDLGVSGVTYLPDLNLMALGGKTADLYLLDPNNMGGYNTNPNPNLTYNDNVVQEFAAKNGHLHGSSVYWNCPAIGPSLYIWSEYDHGKRYQFVNTGSVTTPAWRMLTTPASITNMAAPDGMPGGMLALSANGNQAGTGILWVTMPTSLNANQMIVPGTLRAFDATDLSKELWNSDMATGDHIGLFGKFAPVTIANGRVYAATFSSQLCVYGLRQTAIAQ